LDSREESPVMWWSCLASVLVVFIVAGRAADLTLEPCAAHLDGNMKSVNGALWMCCGGFYRDGTGIARGPPAISCCNGKLFDMYHQICCDGHIQDKKHGTNTLCCGRHTINPNTTNCCVGSLRECIYNPNGRAVRLPKAKSNKDEL